MKFPLLLAAALLFCSCSYQNPEFASSAPDAISPAAREAARQAFIKRILSLPPYLIHEETPAEFRRNLSKGDFFYNEEQGISGMELYRDGIFGKHIITAYKDGRLEVDIIHNQKEPRLDNYRYDEATQRLILSESHYLPIDGGI